MKKMLFGLITAIATFTGCESDQSASKLPRIDLTATSFTSGQIEIADEIESIEYVPLELTLNIFFATNPTPDWTLKRPC